MKINKNVNISDDLISKHINISSSFDEKQGGISSSYQNLTENKKKKKTVANFENKFLQFFLKILPNKILSFLNYIDFFPEEINFTFKLKDKFTTFYGYIISFIFCIIFLLLFINNVFFFNNKNECSFTEILPYEISSYEIDLSKDLLIYVHSYSTDKKIEVNSVEQLYDIVIFFLEYEYEGNTKKIKYKSEEIFFQRCNIDTSEALFDSSAFTDKYVLCPEKGKLVLNKNVNIYNTKLVVGIKNIFLKYDLMINAIKDIEITFNFISFDYIEHYNSFTSKIITKKSAIKDFLGKEEDYYNDSKTGKLYSKNTSPNIISGYLSRSKLVSYSGYFNIKKENIKYSFASLDNDMCFYRDGGIILSYQFDLPIKTTVKYNQKYSIFFIFGIFWGWLVFLYVGFTILFHHLISFNFLQNINNELFSLQSPEHKKKINMLSNEIDHKLSEVKTKKELLELIVEDLYKSKQYSGIYLGIWGSIYYVLCWWNSCCKSKKQHLIHQTVTTSIKEGKKIFDVVNICNFVKEVKLLNEVVCEPNQKKMINYLIRKTVDEEGERGNNNFIEQEKEVFLEKTKNLRIGERKMKKLMMKKFIIDKNNIEDALVLMKNINDNRNGKKRIENKLIDYIKISSNIKNLFFTLRSKKKNKKGKNSLEIDDVTKYFEYIRYLNKLSSSIGGESTSRRTEFSEIQNYISFYKDYLDLNRKTLELLEKANHHLLSFSSKILNHYSIIFDENLVVKENAFGAACLDSSFSETSIEKMRLNAYHPLYFSSTLSNKEAISNIFETKENALFQTFTDIFILIMFTIDTIFRVSASTIDEMNNKSIVYAFDAIRSCIRISFLTCLCYLYYFIVTFINNKRDGFCKESIMCLGYLSFAKEPDNINNVLVFSHIVYIIALFGYVINLSIRYFLNNNGSDYFKNEFSYTKTIFSSPSLKIYTQTQAFQNIQDVYYCIIDYHSKFNIIWNIMITIVNVLILLGAVSAALLSVVMFFIFKESKMSYVMRMFIFVVFLSLVTNTAFIVSHEVVKQYSNISNKTFLFVKFWVPFLIKFSTYILYLSMNMNIFLGVSGGFFYSNFTIQFYPNEFICREDQAAFNLIFFLCVEFLIRKFFLFFIHFFKPKSIKIGFSPEQSIANTICQYFLLANIQLVFPIAGVFTVIIFVVDYHLEVFFINKFHLKCKIYEYADLYNVFIILSFYANLICNIIFAIIVFNQYNIMNNSVEESEKIIPRLCKHQSVKDDFMTIFRNSFDIETINLYESFELFLVVPAGLGLIVLIGYGKKLFMKSNNEMKIIITANKDLKWENLSKKMDEILRFEKKMKFIYFKTANKLNKTINVRAKRENAKGIRGKVLI